jgi:hypothetical protein
VSAQPVDADAWLASILAANAALREKAIREAPKLPKLSYRQRRAEWAAIGLEGEDAARAMERELNRRR